MVAFEGLRCSLEGCPTETSLSPNFATRSDVVWQERAFGLSLVSVGNSHSMIRACIDCIPTVEDVPLVRTDSGDRHVWRLYRWYGLCLTPIACSLETSRGVLAVFPLREIPSLAWEIAMRARECIASSSSGVASCSPAYPNGRAHSAPLPPGGVSFRLWPSMVQSKGLSVTKKNSARAVRFLGHCVTTRHERYPYLDIDDP